MDLNNKKVQKNIIKLALCVNKSNINDLILLDAMIVLKLESLNKPAEFDEAFNNLKSQIADNVHLCALLGIKDKK